MAAPQSRPERLRRRSCTAGRAPGPADALRSAVAVGQAPAGARAPAPAAAAAARSARCAAPPAPAAGPATSPGPAAPGTAAPPPATTSRAAERQVERVPAALQRADVAGSRRRLLPAAARRRRSPWRTAPRVTVDIAVCDSQRLLLRLQRLQVGLALGEVALQRRSRRRCSAPGPSAPAPGPRWPAAVFTRLLMSTTCWVTSCAVRCCASTVPSACSWPVDAVVGGRRDPQHQLGRVAAGVGRARPAVLSPDEPPPLRRPPGR